MKFKDLLIKGLEYLKQYLPKIKEVVFEKIEYYIDKYLKKNKEEPKIEEKTDSKEEVKQEQAKSTKAKEKQRTQEHQKIDKDLEIKNYIYDKTLTFKKEMYYTDSLKQAPYPIVENANSDKVIMLIDDIPFTELLYQSDFAKVKEKYGLDIKKEFRIIKCFGEHAGFTAFKYAIEEGNRIDLAFIDITLGHKIKVYEEWYKELDGIDLAIVIKEDYPEFHFLLCTAHTLNYANNVIKTYDKKVQKYFNRTLEEKYLSKNSDRIDKIYNLIVSKYPELAQEDNQDDNKS